ncbi:MAG: SGNH/GDSL hydrolase family protein [Armatimonadota bacterium]
MGFVKYTMMIMVLGASILSVMPASAGMFKLDDRWCAVGDSITHGGSYHEFVYLYYATRFPNQNIKVYNCGIGGDSAPGVLKRLKWDVLNHKPNVASIMLGMNDVDVFSYGPTKTTPQDIQHHQERIDTYKENMHKLAKELTDAGVKLVFITPSIYDQTSTIETPAYVGANDALGIMSRYVMELSKEFKGTLVNFHGPMTRLNEEQQKINLRFALAGPDRVHPLDVGHLTMAYLFLKDQGVPQYVSSMRINAATRKVARRINCRISDLKVKDDEVSFTSFENALPFPVRESARQALGIVPFMIDLNQEILQVKDLAPGRYRLWIDGKEIGIFDAVELEKGVNLADMPETPQYQQAVKVADLNQKRHDLAVNVLRNISIVEYLYWPTRADGPVTLEEIKPTVDKLIEQTKGQPWATMLEMYIKNKPQEVQINKDVEQLMVDMRKVAVPVPHKYVLKFTEDK